MGEREEEIMAVLEDLRRAGCSYLSIGQYLAPSKAHFPVMEYVPPEIFDQYREYALSLGFLMWKAAPT